MFAQRYGYWTADYNGNHASFSNDGYPYGADPQFTPNNSFHSNNNYVTVISPNGSTCSSHTNHTPSENIAQHHGYLKDVTGRISNREKQRLNHFSPKSVSTCLHDVRDHILLPDYDAGPDNVTVHKITDNACGVVSMKETTILSKFYKPDGTPIMSLWDADATLRENKGYKYDPKPLERRKNPRSFVPDDRKTKDYWERRRKNNMAARKSREDRRRKEIEILKNVENLKNDNYRLKLYSQKILTENQNLMYELELLKGYEQIKKKPDFAVPSDNLKIIKQ